MKHYDTHVSDKTHQCPMCEFKTIIEYELFNHVLHVHGIENVDTTNESLSSLGRIKSQDKIQIETNKKETTPVGTGATERTYLCPTCDFRCSSNAAMKTHMQTHNRPEIYMICDEDLCDFECESKDELQAHKTGHLPLIDKNNADTLKQQDIYSLVAMLK